MRAWKKIGLILNIGLVFSFLKMRLYFLLKKLELYFQKIERLFVYVLVRLK
jgi:uncharacterized membrane protein